MFEAREIYLFHNFQWKNGKSKPKYLIVISQNVDQVILFTLPSSQVYISQEKIKDGCITYPSLQQIEHRIYSFPAKKKIGEQGFSFNKRTFCYGNSLNGLHLNALKSQESRLLDKLKIEEYVELVYCLMHSSEIKTKYQVVLEEILDEHFD